MIDRTSFLALAAGAAALLGSIASVRAAEPQAGPPPAPPIFPSASDTSPQATYVRACAACHAPGGMGANLLARRETPDRAILDRRDDLTAEFVVAAVRNGVGSMPPLNRGAVSDADLHKIAAYLGRSKGARP